jgi:hypothetical protein
MLPLHALFDLRYEGDDALLRFTRRRFEQAGLAAEAYGGSFEYLERLLAYAPRGARPPTVHLPRDIDIVRERDRDRVISFVERFGSRVSGFVVHDRKHMPSRVEEVRVAAEKIGQALAGSGDAWLYLEYASALDVTSFAELAAGFADVDRVSVCLDVGHIGVAAARRRFAELRPGLGFDLGELTPGDARLPDVVQDVQAAVSGGLPAVLELTTAVSRHGKPVHFHLHDGHPVVQGLADHFGFTTRVPVPFWHAGRRSLTPLYGPAGLGSIVRTARAATGGECSFTLEIHQVEARLPVGDAADLFSRWADTTNAERTNAWLAVLASDADLVRAALDDDPPSAEPVP